MARQFRIILLPMLLLAGILTPGAAGATSQPTDSRWGIVQAAEDTAHAVQAGAQWERLVFHWDAYQPGGPGDWTTTDPNLPGYVPDTLLQSQAAAGLTVVGVLLSTPSWAGRDSSGAIAVPKNLNLAYNDPNNYWGQFVARLAARYKGRVDNWVIGNEPDMYDTSKHTWNGSVSDYYQYLKVADQAIKAVNPTATVAVAGMTYWYDHVYNRQQFLDALLGVVMADPTARANGYYFDAVDAHSYSNPLNSYAEAMQFQQFLTNHGISGKQVWETEANVVPNNDPASSHQDGPFRASLDQQAGYMIEAPALALAAGVTRFEIYKMRDTGGEGQGELYGLVRDDGSLRPAYTAYSFATHTFSGVSNVVYSWTGSAVPPTADQVNALLTSDTGRTQFPWPAAVNEVTMRRGNDKITVVWDAAPQAATATLPVAGGTPLLYDKLGNQQPAPSVANGAYQLALQPSTNNSDPRDPSLYLVGGSPMILIEQGAYGLPTPASAPTPAPTPVQPGVPDFALANGHFYRQANGQGGAGQTGYAISDDGGMAFWTDFQQAGGVNSIGYPASQRYGQAGFTYQVTQREVLQWNPAAGRVLFANVFDQLAAAGKDAWLQSARMTPPSRDWASDQGKMWPTVMQAHLAILDADPAIKAKYLSDPNWLDHYGLPMALQDMGPAVVMRGQRAVIQHWKVDAPASGVHAGDITVALGGDIAKEAGLIPAAATLPQNP
ncbi:MAG: hypothetical protein ACR2JY_02790 [Chloroflexota bacterium]